MNTVCLLESVSRADGGIFEAECALQRELYLGQGVQVQVVGMEDRHTSEDVSRWLPLKPIVVSPKGPGALGYSPDLLAALDPKADLLYAATLWKYPSWTALRWAEQTGKPMIVAPHGSLDAWALKNAAWKKQIAAALFKNRQLHKAACLRALCQSEADAFRAYGLKNPIAIIPNGIDLPELPETRDEGRGTRAGGENGLKKTLLFLGRIHPKKGLPNLIRAFKKALGSRLSTLDSTPWQLVIAGWEQGGHEAELMQLCEELELSFSHREHKRHKGHKGNESENNNNTHIPDILFHGPAFGDEKKELLNSADAFILPSLSEGLPMSVLEAWAYGLPVVMTPECNLPEGFDAGAAVRITTGLEGVAGGLDELFSMSDSDLRSMGARGRELVRGRFTWQTVATQMREVYEWTLGAGAAPSCVRIK